jgi:hypothetical protein
MNDEKPEARIDLSKPFGPTPIRIPKKAVDYVFIWGAPALFAYLMKNKALNAMPLLSAVTQRFAMKEAKGEKAREIALTSMVWAMAGNPSKNARELMLDHVKRMPDLVTLRVSKSMVFRYYAGKGPLWKKFEADSRAGKAYFNPPGDGEEGD